jgi:hypothetical protein
MAGSVNDTISLEIVSAPTSIAYSGSANTSADVLLLIKDQILTNEGDATLGGGVPKTCVVSPSLPTGLVIDNATCDISGTPTAVQTVQTYTITATNAANSGSPLTKSITITVDWSVLKPAEMTYPASPYSISDVASASITPTFASGGGTPTSCISNPTLPAGLTLDQATCAITGTPTSAGAVASALYTITASNMAGSVNDTISLELVSAPTSIAYSGSANTSADVLLLIKDQILTNEGDATLGGGVPKTCVVSPSLPTGLVIDNATCDISGTPTAVQTVQTYTITATNAANSGSPLTKSITITVDWSVLKPAEMTYPASPYSISDVASASITPTFASGGGTPTSCISNPTLPAGLTLDQATCAITGTPTSTGALAPALYTITASNVAGSVNDTISLELVSAPTSIAYSGSANTTADVLLLIKDQILTNEGDATLGGGVPKTCVVSPSLPTGLVIDNATCDISGTPTAVQTVQTYTITATNAANSGSPLTKSITITVDWSVLKPAEMTFPASPYSISDVASASITPTFASGGGTPTSCISNPTLPAGLTLDQATCAITGTPTSAGALAPALYTITASNVAGSVNDTISLELVSAPTSIAYSGSANTTADVLLLIKDQILTNEGDATLGGGVPKTCEVSPSLPTGLVIDNATCDISGTPTAVQTVQTYTITATNAANSGTPLTKSITITVDWSVLKPAEMTYPSSPYSISDVASASITPTFASGGGTPTSCTSNPTLPAGLTLDQATCAITGTPTSAGAVASALYTITASNMAGSVNDTISLEIVSAPTSIAYSGSANTSADVLLLIKDQILTNEGDATLGGGVPKTCVVSPSLPTGLVIDNATCDISGTPTAVQTVQTYTITATNAANSGSPLTKSITITVDWSVLKPAEMTYPASPYSISDVASASITPTFASGGGTPTSCISNPTLPAGLTLDQATCAITGTPTSAGALAPALYTITASNVAGSVNDTISLEIVSAPTSIAYSGSANTTADVLLLIKDQILTNEGDATLGGGVPKTCVVSPSLPTGLVIDNASCDISGTPTAVQTVQTYTITATNAANSGSPLTKSITITVDWSVLKPAEMTYPASPYSISDVASASITPTFASGGGTPTSCISNPTLPAGLTLDQATCAITGTPTSAGAFASALYTITASNGWLGQ